MPRPQSNLRGAATERPAVLVLGIGNEFRGDDAAGLLAVRKVNALGAPNVVVREFSGEGAAIIDAMDLSIEVIICDAVNSGSPLGTIHRLDAAKQRIPSRFFHYSTHEFSLAEAIELARVLGKLPPRLTIYGIEGRSFAAGCTLSAEVQTAVQRVADEILSRLACPVG